MDPSGKKTAKTPGKDDAAATAAAAAKSKPLLPKSSILRLLAELVRSYVGFALAIAQYQNTGSQTSAAKEVWPNPKRVFVAVAVAV